MLRQGLCRPNHPRKGTSRRGLTIVFLLGLGIAPFTIEPVQACAEIAWFNPYDELANAEVVVRAIVVAQREHRQHRWIGERFVPDEMIFDLQVIETLWGFPALPHWTARMLMLTTHPSDLRGKEVIVYLKKGVDQSGQQYPEVVQRSCAASILTTHADTVARVKEAIGRWDREHQQKQRYPLAPLPPMPLWPLP